MSDTDQHLPQRILVQQEFPPSPPVDVPGILRRDLPPLLTRLPAGAEVAVAVGSRGITDIAVVVKAALDVLRGAGLRPFIVPAMGSHGGATPEGQTALLAGMGITETSSGVPIRAAIEIESVGKTADGLEVVTSKVAAAAAGVLLINRVKPHTDFGGEMGSGLQKMLVVGLGKPAGAAAFHRAASRLGYAHVLRHAAEVLLGRLPVLGGIALVEDQRHQTARLDVIPAEVMASREPELCAAANTLMPRLPFGEIDLLIVDRMGKDISGTGMDPAVIGRMIHGYSLSEEAPHSKPYVRRLFVRDLTPASHGNAIGLGMADFTTTRLVQAMDRDATTINSLTALSLQGAKVPIYCDTDREVLGHALATLALPDVGQARVVRITDTLAVERFEASAALAQEVARIPHLRVVATLGEFAFDTAGNLATLGKGPVS